jgi:hypothetical protein
MRLTTMTQSAKGLPETMGEEETVPLRDEVVRQLERSKWFLWHGKALVHESGKRERNQHVTFSYVKSKNVINSMGCAYLCTKAAWR